MMELGIVTYTTEKYANLRFNLVNVNTNRASVEKAAELVNCPAAVVHFGAAETPPNSAIRIKKHMRCPGARKLIKSFRKLDYVVVISVNEVYNSQTCPRCFERFNPSTKSHRFKVCQNCRPQHQAMLPPMIEQTTSTH